MSDDPPMYDPNQVDEAVADDVTVEHRGDYARLTFTVLASHRGEPAREVVGRIVISERECQKIADKIRSVNQQ